PDIATPSGVCYADAGTLSSGSIRDTGNEECGVLLDPRLWLLIGLSLAMLFTIEAIEEFVEGAWPQMRRPANGWGVVSGTQTLWAAVALFVLPGLVLTILNLAILVAEDLPYANAQLLGTIFVVIGWLVYLATTTDLGGVGTYLQEVGL